MYGGGGATVASRWGGGGGRGDGSLSTGGGGGGGGYSSLIHVFLILIKYVTFRYNAAEFLDCSLQVMLASDKKDGIYDSKIQGHQSWTRLFIQVDKALTRDEIKKTFSVSSGGILLGRNNNDTCIMITVMNTCVGIPCHDVYMIYVE